MATGFRWRTEPWRCHSEGRLGGPKNFSVVVIRRREILRPPRRTQDDSGQRAQNGRLSEGDASSRRTLGFSPALDYGSQGAQWFPGNAILLTGAGPPSVLADSPPQTNGVRRGGLNANREIGVPGDIQRSANRQSGVPGQVQRREMPVLLDAGGSGAQRGPWLRVTAI